ELVTVGQRKGLGTAGGGARRYALSVDVARAEVVVGTADDLLVDGLELTDVVWAGDPVAGPVEAQCSAHGRPRAAEVEVVASGRARLRWRAPQRAVAPGQSVVLYDGDTVAGGGLVSANTP